MSKPRSHDLFVLFRITCSREIFSILNREHLDKLLVQTIRIIIVNNHLGASVYCLSLEAGDFVSDATYVLLHYN